MDGTKQKACTCKYTAGSKDKAVQLQVAPCKVDCKVMLGGSRQCKVDCKVMLGGSRQCKAVQSSARRCRAEHSHWHAIM